MIISTDDYPKTLFPRLLHVRFASLFHAMGEAIADWAYVEGAMGAVLCRVTGLDYYMGHNIIFSTSSFDNKNRTVRAAMLTAHGLTDLEKTYLDKLLKISMDYSRTRNAIVHRTPSWSTKGGAALVEGQRTPGLSMLLLKRLTVDQITTASINFRKLGWLLHAATMENIVAAPDENIPALLLLAESLPSDPLANQPTPNQRGRQRQQQAAAKAPIPKRSTKAGPQSSERTSQNKA